MSWVRVWVHLVFSTKNREQFLRSKEIKEKVINHILLNAKEKNIWIEEINGYFEHIHCLISLGREQSISKVAQLIKGESSMWINKERLMNFHFAWQDDYWAVSIGESHLNALKEYIKNQEEHHKVKSFSGEVDEFMKKYSWEM